MKVLFSHNIPFHLAHGGVQTQIEAIMSGLKELGVEVEPEHWWDSTQTGDIIHFFGRPPFASVVRLAKDKGMKTVMFENLDRTASRSSSKLFLQRWFIRLAKASLRGMVTRFAWDVYQELDAMIFVTDLERQTARYLFDAVEEREYVIGHGLTQEALSALSEPAAESDYLVYVATIAERKNTVLLAEAAHRAGVPVMFLGKPYAETDPYYRQFLKLVDQKLVRYPGYVTEEEKWRILREARGFVLWSQFESGCIAVYEAAASGLPMLLPDLPWASREYGKVDGVELVSPEQPDLAVKKLSDFYSRSHRRSVPLFQIGTWKEVARRYLEVYQSIVK